MPDNLLFSIKANTRVCLDGIKQSFAENSTIVANLTAENRDFIFSSGAEEELFGVFPDGSLVFFSINLRIDYRFFYKID